MGAYRPPFGMRDEITVLVSEISEEVGRISVLQEGHVTPQLRRRNRIRTIHSSLAIETDCSHRQACGVLVDRLAPCPYTILRLWDQGCRPEHLNCRPSTPLGTLATGFCLSAWRDSQLPHIISIFLLTLKFLLLEPLFRC